MTAIETRVEHRPMPITATMKGVRELFGLPEALVRRLAAENVIRSYKLGPSVKCGRVYRVDDIIEALENGTYMEDEA